MVNQHHISGSQHAYSYQGYATAAACLAESDACDYAGGRLQQKVFPNDLKTAYTYFKDNQVKSIVTTDGSTEKMRHEYTYNSAGDTATASHTLGSTTQSRSYEYDGLGRLTKEIDSVAVADLDVIAYDQFGNRRERTVGGQKHVYSHNNLHQITNIRQDSDVGPVIANFDYDDNGNMTSKTFAGTTAAIGYDALDRVNTVTKDGIASEQYAYDHGIRRIKKTVGSAAVDYHYSGPDIIAEYSNGVATPQAIYAHGAAMDDPLWRKEASNDPLYYHGDAQGSVVGMSDKTGALTASNRYDAWGNVTAKTGSTAQYGYSGREPNDNGLIYYRSRYYDPEIGRFTQMDPKGFIDGVNRYTYVLNSPVNYVDPWGTNASGFTNTGNAGGSGFAPWVTQGQITDWRDRANGINGQINAIENGNTFNGQEAAVDGLRAQLSGISREIAVANDTVGLTTSTPVLNVLGAGALARTGFSAAAGLARPAVVPKYVSTGRTTPYSLNEKLAMEEVKANPSGYTPPRFPKMSDGKNNLFARDGWVKRQQLDHDVNIHYVENVRTGEFIDFKFVE